MKTVYDPMRDDVGFSTWIKPELKQSITAFADSNNVKVRDVAAFAFELMLSAPSPVIERLTKAKDRAELTEIARQVWTSAKI